jgi:sec-independent protein translocase protein TatB
MSGAGVHAFLQNFSTGELVVVAVVALVVLGPERLPDAARSLGKMLHKLRTMSEGLREDMKDVLDDPSMGPIKELGELAADPKGKLAAYAQEAQEEEALRKQQQRAAEFEASTASEISAGEISASGVAAETGAEGPSVDGDTELERSDPAEPAVNGEPELEQSDPGELVVNEITDFEQGDPAEPGVNSEPVASEASTVNSEPVAYDDTRELDRRSTTESAEPG